MPNTPLPCGTPVHISTSNAHTQRGLSYSRNPGVIPSPIRKPFTAWSNGVFPWVKGTDVSPDAIKPSYGVAGNNYSPSFHRPFEPEPVPALRIIFAGKSKGSQRVTGKSVPWPFAQPNYAPLIPR